MFSQLVVIGLLAFTMVQAKYIPEAADKVIEEEVHYPASPYHYKYEVEDEKTGDYKSHQEESDGENVKGQYTVADPDGTVRSVKYTVGKHTGFQAIVTTHGEHEHKVEYYGYPAEFQEAESKSNYLHRPLPSKNVNAGPKHYQNVDASSEQE